MCYLIDNTLPSVRWSLTNSNWLLFSEFFKKETRILDLFEINFNIDEIVSVYIDNITKGRRNKSCIPKTAKEKLSDDVGGIITSGLAYKKEIKHLKYFNEHGKKKIKIN